MPQAAPATTGSPTRRVPRLHDDGGHRAPADLEVGLEHRAPGPALGAGPELLHLGHQGDLLEQVVDAGSCRAETSTVMVSPPQASGTSPRSESCCSTRSGSASARSILLMATMIGTSAALAWSMASTVWGMTPSSAATTSTTMSVTSAPRARMAVKASWPGVSMKVIELVAPGDLVGADVLGDPAGLAGHHVGGADPVEQQRLAVVDVAHHRDHRRPGPEVGLVHLLVVLVLEVLGEELGLLLLAGVDQADLGAELGREQLDHVVGERLGGGDHLALQEQEADDVAGRAVELGTEVARRRPALDDDLALGNRGGGRRVGGELGRLELFEVAAPTPGPALGRPPTRNAAPSSGGAAADRTTAAGTPGEASTAPGPPGRGPKPPPGDHRHQTAPAVHRTAAGRCCHRDRDRPGGGAERRPPMPGGGGMGRPLGPTGGRTGGGGTSRPDELSGGRGGRWPGAGREVVGAAPPGPAAAAGATGWSAGPVGGAGGGAVGAVDGGRLPGASVEVPVPSGGLGTDGAAAGAAGAGAVRAAGRGRGGRRTGRGRGGGGRGGRRGAGRRGCRAFGRAGRGRRRRGCSPDAGGAGPLRPRHRRTARLPRRRWPAAAVPAAAFLAGARLAGAFFSGAGSSGWTGRRNPSASAFRRTRSAWASSIEDEWLLTPMPSARHRSSASLLVSPSSRPSS